MAEDALAEDESETARIRIRGFFVKTAPHRQLSIAADEISRIENLMQAANNGEDSKEPITVLTETNSSVAHREIRKLLEPLPLVTQKSICEEEFSLFLKYLKGKKKEKEEVKTAVKATVPICLRGVCDAVGRSSKPARRRKYPRVISVGGRMISHNKTDMFDEEQSCAELLRKLDINDSETEKLATSNEHLTEKRTESSATKIDSNRDQGKPDMKETGFIRKFKYVVPLYVWSKEEINFQSDKPVATSPEKRSGTSVDYVLHDTWEEYFGDFPNNLRSKIEADTEARDRANHNDHTYAKPAPADYQKMNTAKEEGQ